MLLGLALAAWSLCPLCSEEPILMARGDLIKVDDIRRKNADDFTKHFEKELRSVTGDGESIEVFRGTEGPESFTILVIGRVGHLQRMKLLGVAHSYLAKTDLTSFTLDFYERRTLHGDEYVNEGPLSRYFETLRTK